MFKAMCSTLHAYILKITLKDSLANAFRTQLSDLRAPNSMPTPLGDNIHRRTVIFENITFLIQKHFKTVTVTVILGKLIQMTFKTVIK